MRQSASQSYATATDLADYLVKKGLAFRDAHEIVGKTVAAAIEANKGLTELSLNELQVFSKTIQDDVYEVLSLEGSVNSRNHIGGTAPQQVLVAIKKAQQTLGNR